MERAAYCQNWLAGRPNSHPVHPMKHMGMIEEFVRNHITLLSWSMMGGGAISLPFLESQITQPVPPSLRFHGYMNDGEFNEECLRRGILPFAVIYQAQNWEFPVRYNEDKSHITEINILRREGEHEWYGMREFTRDTYPKLFPKKFADYFPNGLVNSDGERVTDLWEECAARDIYGNPVHSSWVEVEYLTHTCHGTCRNNPVWREYLKKQIEIVIDHGALAVQLDECENPLTSVGYGGCFCKDCMKQFRDYLKRRRGEGTLREELAKMDLDTFDYAKYLRERNIRWPEKLKDAPFVEEYWEFQVETENKTFQETVAYVKDYGRRTKGADIKVSANFFNLHMLYRSSLDILDLCVTENRRTVLRRPEWFRMAAGYTGGKALILAESPYDGFMQKFVELIHKGEADDYYRLLIMESAAHGCNFAFPYGAWMGNKAKDAFYPPKEAAVEVQDFLRNNDAYIGKKSGANVLVLYDYRSNLFRDWQSNQGEGIAYKDIDELTTYTITSDDRASRVPYFEVAKRMVDERIPYDVCVLGDGKLVPDTFSAAGLAGYDMLVLPDCGFLTGNQAAVLREAAAKKKIFIYGSYAKNIPGEADAIRAAGAKQQGDISDLKTAPVDFCHALEEAYRPCRILDWDNGSIYVQQCMAGKAKVLHLLNYAFDKNAHRTIPQEVNITVRQGAVDYIKGLTLDGSPLRIEFPESLPGNLTLKVSGLPCYAMIIIENKQEG
jgi:hypothetical protein